MHIVPKTFIFLTAIEISTDGVKKLNTLATLATSGYIWLHEKDF